MEYELTRPEQFGLIIISFILASLMLWSISRNNKNQLGSTVATQPESLVIKEYKVEADFINLLKTAVILSVNAFFFIIIPTSLIVMFVAEIWPTSFFLFVVTYFGMYIFGLLNVLIILVPSIYFRPYPQTIFYHELSGLLRQQGKYVWTIAHQPFIVVDVNGISGRFTLPWKKVCAVTVIDNNKLQISYNRKPHWLVNLLQANSFVLTVESSGEANRIVDLWQDYSSK